jgi:hypothetical protein
MKQTKIHIELLKLVRIVYDFTQVSFKIKLLAFQQDSSLLIVNDIMDGIVNNECELIDNKYKHQFSLQTKEQVKIVL